MYRGPLHNVFVMSSTWIVIAVSSERCFAIHSPIRARLLTIRAWRAVAVYMAVFAVSAAVCAPQFVRYSVVEVPCSLLSATSGDDSVELDDRADRRDGPCFLPRLSSLFFLHSTFRRVYYVVLLIVGHLLPLFGLVVTGAVLVVALYRHRRRHDLSRQRQLQQQVTVASLNGCGDCSATTTWRRRSGTGSSGRSRGGGQRSPVDSLNDRHTVKFRSVTTTIVLIVLSFFTLVSPSIVVETIQIIGELQRMTSGQVRNKPERRMSALYIRIFVGLKCMNGEEEDENRNMM